jgi:hypothetical protein
VIRARSLLSPSLSLPLTATLRSGAVLLPGLAPGLALAGVAFAPGTAQAADDGSISGVVKDEKTKQPIKDAIVVVQCTCLQGELTVNTNASGLYAFRDLPPGTYTVQVLAGKADVSKTTTLPRGAKFRANFTINPENEFVIDLVVDSTPVQRDTTTSTVIDAQVARDVPVGGSRDFSALVEIAPTATKDSAGISLAGTTSAESKYTVDGAQVNNPSFGTLGASIVQEFIQTVEVIESGYEAEFGGASGGQVRARRVSGANKVRGVAVMRVSPRLAQPRFIIATDEALRVTSVGDYDLQGVVQASGPIVKDKLFWSAGVAVGYTQFSLNQRFYSRIDRDDSGGFEDCPFVNGDNDCADGANYIDSTNFATTVFNGQSAVRGPNLWSVQYQGVLDWAINQKHRLTASAGGAPVFQRTSYRLPFSIDPNSFGTSPSASPLGGGARVATGIVDDHFGTNFGNQWTVSLNYLGRVLDDKLEIDAGFAYSQFAIEEAWRLDNPDLKNLPTRQEQDAQGSNLYEFLDREQAVDFVPGVDEQCNASSLPGLACPVRTWLSGGIGEYNQEVNRRAEGRLALTHFFNGAGSHQLKYGAQVEHIERDSRSQYSGSNGEGFYDNCPPGQEGGGEYCYDPSTNQYTINTTTRVNNNRFVVVDTDTPDNQTTVGYGRIRREQNDLRAIATPIGDGARVQAYEADLSTQNYGVFLQDRWAVLSNLYLNFGVRWELQDMRDALGDRAIFIWDNVAPRVGVVYDWTDEGKSRLYASYGWFYQPLPLQLNSRVFGGLVTVQRTYRSSDCNPGNQVTVDGIPRPTADAANLPTEWCTDSRASTTGLVEGSVVPRLRGQYNQQFQTGYEQEVIEDLTLGVRWLHTDLGRAVEDVSTDGGSNFIIANPGEGVSSSDLSDKSRECDAIDAQLAALSPDDPTRPNLQREALQCRTQLQQFTSLDGLFDTPVRNFDAFTFEVKKRFAKNWLFIGSYTFSRLVGNYDGFVDPVSGAINIGASSQFDIPELVRNSYGPLSFNQPHRVRANGFYSFDLQQAGRLTLGTSFNFASGYPVNLRGDNNRYPGGFLVYVLPRGAAGRVEPNYQWNLSLAYAYPLPGQLELEVSARLFNVTNAKAALRVDEVYTFQNTRAVAGGDLDDLKHTKQQNPGNPSAFFDRNIVQPQGNFGVETQFQQPLSGQFELVLRF